MPSGHSRLLYTSRDKGFAGSLGAKNYEVGFLDPEQARTFLARWSGFEKRPLPEPYASEILAECKGLVLGLAMVGATLRAQPEQEWADMVVGLKKARLKEIGIRPGGYAYQTLHASIAVSVNALDRENKTRYPRSFQARRVNNSGDISWHKGRVFVSEVFCNEEIGLEQMDEDVHSVFFCNTELGEFNTSEMRFRPVLRP
jgi:hypothetical protein